MSRTSIILSFLFLLCNSVWAGDDGKADAQFPLKLSDTPKAIQELAAAIKSKPRDEVEDIVIKHLGQPHRDVGSGISIYKWDVGDGTLTLASPSSGNPEFSMRGHPPLLLIQTKNQVHENLIGSYELRTLPNPKNGATYWMGNFSIAADMTYTYQDSGAHDKAAAADEFLILHPAGKVTIQYSDKITADTLLESLAEGIVIAEITFSADGTKDQMTIRIQSERHMLRIVSAKPPKAPLKFSGNKGCDNY